MRCGRQRAPAYFYMPSGCYPLESNQRAYIGKDDFGWIKIGRTIVRPQGECHGRRSSNSPGPLAAARSLPFLKKTQTLRNSFGTYPKGTRPCDSPLRGSIAVRISVHVDSSHERKTLRAYMPLGAASANGNASGTWTVARVLAIYFLYVFGSDNFDNNIKNMAPNP